MGLSIPAKVLRNVDLPEPFVPIKTTSEPGEVCNSMFETTVWRPKPIERSVAEIVLVDMRMLMLVR